MALLSCSYNCVLCLPPAGVGAQSSFKAIPLACLAGLVVGLAVGFVIYYGGHSIKDLKIFFIISTVMLFFIAAGQVCITALLLSWYLIVSPCMHWAADYSWSETLSDEPTGCMWLEVTPETAVGPAHPVVFL